MAAASHFFIGVTRFSLYIPNSRSWNTSAEATSDAEYREKLFDPERLDARLDIFLNMSLPQIAAASKNHSVMHIVQYSSLLPPEYQNALEEAAKQYDFLELYCNDSLEQHDSVINTRARELASNMTASEVTFAWYRLDDDDLLATNFFDSMEKYVVPEHAGFVVSLGRGFSAFYRDGSLWNLRELYRPKTSVGQLYVCTFDKKTGSFIEPPRQNHALIDKWAPLILDSREPSFLTMLHPHQDGHSRGRGKEALEAILKEQDGLPYLDPSRTFGSCFTAIGSASFEPSESLLSVRRSGGPTSVPVTVSPIEFEVPEFGSLTSIDFSFSTVSATAGARVFIGLEYEGQERPAPHWPWQEYGNQINVFGRPLGPSVSGRVILDLGDVSVRPSKLLIWHSKNQESPVYLDSLAVSTKVLQR